MLGWGFADFFAKSTIDSLGDLTTLFWAQAIGVLPLLGIFAVTRTVPEMEPLDLIWLTLFGVFSGLSYLPLYAGFAKGPVSVLSPVFAAYAAVVVLLSAVFFGEQISIDQALAIGVVLAGVVLISTDPRELGRLARGRSTELSAGLPEVLCALLIYSVWLVLLDRFIHGRDWVFFLLVIRSVATATLLVYAHISGRSLRVNQRSLMPYLALIGCCDVAAFAFVAWGFSASPHISIVAVLSSTFSLPTILLARLFLKERLVLTQKLAAGVILLGVALVSVR
jgi:uncharacterized membrane protein